MIESKLQTLFRAHLIASEAQGLMRKLAAICAELEMDANLADCSEVLQILGEMKESFQPDSQEIDWESFNVEQ
jgi:hypothetical protein